MLNFRMKTLVSTGGKTQDHVWKMITDDNK